MQSIHRSLPLVLSCLLTVLSHGQSSSLPSGVSADDWADIRAAREAGRHAIVATDIGHQARNPGQSWTTTFDERAFTTQPDVGGWSWGLELERYGWGEFERVATTPLQTAVDGQRYTRTWDSTLSEWYINDQRGLEHGYVVHTRPAQAVGTLRLELRVRGDLVPSIASSGRDIAFHSAAGALVLDYAGLTVVDADGDALDARFERSAQGLLLSVDDSGADYPLVIDPIAQQAYLKASNPDILDAFGSSIAVSANTVVVGAPFEDSNASGVNGDSANNGTQQAGAAYVFVRSGGIWSQQAYLKASNPGFQDYFGTSVAVSGDTIVVGAQGEGSNATGINGNQADNSMTASGAAYVFVRSSGTWSQQAYLKASNTGSNDLFGLAVTVSGDTVVVGAYCEHSNATGVNGNQADNSLQCAGAAYVFVRSGTTWSQQAYLKASNTGYRDFFGGSVAVSGDTVVVAAHQEDSNAIGINGNQADESAVESGAAYVFVRSGSAWSQQAYLKASNTGPWDQFGDSVAVSGDTVVVGAADEDSNATGLNGNQANNAASDSGAVYVFVRSGAVWNQQAYMKASNTANFYSFGNSVAISDDTVVVGSYTESSGATGIDGVQSGQGSPGSGAAYVFVRSGSTWSQQTYLKASNTVPFPAGYGDHFGCSVAVSGDTVAVGALNEDSNATGVNGNPASNSTQDSGAAYVFDLDFWELVPGCLPNGATYIEPTGAARIGTTSQVQLLGGAIANGLVVTYYGVKSVDGHGCGVLLSASEELLLGLVPSPTLLGISGMSGGLAVQSVSVPNDPALVGVEIALQAGLLDTVTSAVEFSNALELQVRP